MVRVAAVDCGTFAGSNCPLIPLDVSGPFHTALLELLVKSGGWTRKVSFNDFDLPLVENTEATMKSEDVESTFGPSSKETGSVYGSITRFQDFGVDEVIEIGPKNLVRILEENW